MSNKDKFENYIENKTDYKADFSRIDSQIEVQESGIRKSKKRVGLAISLTCGFVVLGVLGTFTYKILDGQKVVHKNQKDLIQTYSLNDRKVMEEDSFKVLNSITYPTKKGENTLDKNFIEAINNFSSNLFNSSVKTLDDVDFTISPLSLYFELNNISLLSSSDNLNKEFDNLLGYNKENRINELIKTFKNNFYLESDQKTTTQIYNSVFFNNAYTLNEDYIEKLTNSFVEAFSMDFNENNLDHIIDWINFRLNTNSTINKDDLNLDSFTTMYIFSLLYFKNEWTYKVNDTDNFEGTFYGSNGSSKVTFMQHSFGSILEEKDDYISFFDLYQNGYKIKYIYSKNENLSTLDAIKNDDIFTINSDNYKNADIKLSFPKFSKKTNVNLVNVLKDMGFNTVFNLAENNFPDIYTDYHECQYVDFIKQFNEVDFNENGTIIKTVTYGKTNGDSAPDHTEYYEITLNHPFIYVIYDSNNVPLYVGNVVNI